MNKNGATDLTRHWHRIINTMNDGLMLVGPEGKILMVNRSFELLTGYSSEEVVGRPCQLIGCDACESMLTGGDRGWCKLFDPDQEDLRRCRCAIIRKDGSLVPAIKNASVLRDETGNVLGAVETITDVSEVDRLDQRLESLARQLGDCEHRGIIGASPAMRRVFQLVEKAAHSDSPIIIFGESGTGKELVARAVHDQGRRKEGPYVQLNCAALNAALLESELFGHVKGAFTGAFRHRMGRFEAAHGGDLFLDEIGDIPLSIQVKLLRVLETGQFDRVGDHHPIRVDVRIISATNKNLPQLIARQQFREDLFFRINVIPIYLPPLRERKEDIPLLVSAFIQRLQRITGKSQVTGLTPAAMRRFMEYSWPGNVRELKSALEYAFVVAEAGLIDLDHLPPQHPPGEGMGAGGAAAGDPAEKTALIDALRQVRGNQTQAARRLGITRGTVWNRIRKYGIDLHHILRS
ncbi:MAG: sigma 54-interacting transcriptional regulator [Desulfobacterales bacterium]|nr:sigma 54-interacting transcriptional regulator [Desulfobacterales bacterium]